MMQSSIMADHGSPAWHGYLPTLCSERHAIPEPKESSLPNGKQNQAVDPVITSSTSLEAFWTSLLTQHLTATRPRMWELRKCHTPHCSGCACCYLLTTSSHSVVLLPQRIFAAVDMGTYASIAHIEPYPCERLQYNIRLAPLKAKKGGDYPHVCQINPKRVVLKV